MPFSDPANKSWTAEKIKEINPRTVLDVGAGAGVYLDIIRKNLDQDVNVVGVEIWEPYIEKFNLKDRYDKIIVKDVRLIDDFDYDLVIFGDVLQHMSEEDAVKLWNKVSKQARAAIIAIPIIQYPQGAHEGNPYEVHVEEDWNPEKVKKAFCSIVESKEFEVTGVYVARFQTSFTHKVFHLQGDLEREEYTQNINNYLGRYSKELNAPTIKISNVEEVKEFIKENPDFLLDLRGYEIDNIQGWKFGEIGVWASNFLAWKKFLTTQSDYLILMEDDILFEEEFVPLLKAYINELPPNWDTFHLKAPPTQFHFYNSSLDVSENLCKVFQGHWMLCYVLSKKGAALAIKTVERGVSLPVDWYFFLQTHVFNSYTIKPQSKTPVSAAPTESTIQRQDRQVIIFDS